MHPTSFGLLQQSLRGYRLVREAMRREPVAEPSHSNASACAWCHGAYCDSTGRMQAMMGKEPCMCETHDGSRQDEYEHACSACGRYVCGAHVDGDGTCPDCVE
jgi:hypothetical protein